jgi:hypothetical protein
MESLFFVLARPRADRQTLPWPEAPLTGHTESFWTQEGKSLPEQRFLLPPLLKRRRAELTAFSPLSLSALLSLLKGAGVTIYPSISTIHAIFQTAKGQSEMQEEAKWNRGKSFITEPCAEP